MDHDLGSTAGAVVPRQKHAVFEVHAVVQRLERPDIAVRQHQHDAAGVTEAARLDRGMQVETQRVVVPAALHAAAGRRRQRVLAVQPRAVLSHHQHAAMD